MSRHTRFGVYGLALGERGLLLSRISARVPGGVGKWTLPGGGMAWGETAEETLAREMGEETGLEMTVLDLLGVRSFLFNERGREHHLLQAVYLIEAEGEPRVVEVDGSVDLAAWHALDALGHLNTTTLVGHALGWMGR
jgi:ADP-ribose pyrophosphatase YjhB (NUDIX family)